MKFEGPEREMPK